MLRSSIRDIISRNIGYRIIDRKKGFNKKAIQHYHDQLLMSNYSQRDIEQYQLKKLNLLLEHAKNNVPYYSTLFENNGINLHEIKSIKDLKKIPIMRKNTLIENKKSLLSTDSIMSELTENSSGGSTGVTVNFYQNFDYTTKQVGSAYYFNSIAGWRKGDRIASLWGAPNDFGQALSFREKLKGYLLNYEVFDSFNMSNEMMDSYHKRLSRFRPDVMICYANSIYMFAKFLNDNDIKPNYPKKGIISSAECLTDAMRETIENTFKVKVFNRYGSREVGLVAAECDSHSGMHINWMDVIVEVDNEHDSYDSGKLLITNLNNYATPFIRYEIGDVGELATQGNCSCGRKGPILVKMAGRVSDMFKTYNGNIIHGEYFTHLFYGVDAVKRFQFVQEDRYNFTLNIVKNDKHWDESVINDIERKMKEALGEKVFITINFCEDIPVTASGKYRFTISKI